MPDEIPNTPAPEPQLPVFIDPPWDTRYNEKHHYDNYFPHFAQSIAAGQHSDNELLWYPGDDEDEDEPAFMALDTSAEAEAARRASPRWPYIHITRRNWVRREVLGLPLLAVPPLPESPRPEPTGAKVKRLKPLKRVAVEDIKRQYPALGQAVAGCTCQACKRERKTNPVDPLDAQTDAQKILLKDFEAKGRTFGVEIECYIPRSQAAADAGLNDYQYLQLKIGEAGLRTGGGNWRLKTDASLDQSPPRHQPVEIVSPVLRGEDGLEQIRKVAGVLNAIDAKVNVTTGLHVHVGAGDLTLAQRRNLISQFIRYERFFDLIMPVSRRANRFAKSLREHASATRTNSTKAAEHAILRVLDIKTQHDLNGISTWSDHHMRLSGVTGHGTFEFRQHSGTTNADKITNWVRLVLGFFNEAIKTPALPFYSRKISDEEEMERFFEAFVIPRDLRAYYRKRHAVLYANPEDDS